VDLVQRVVNHSLAAAILWLAALAFMLPGGAFAVEKPAANLSAPINSEQWAKILTRLKEKGISRTLPPRVTEQLGLTKGRESLSVLELAVEREGYQHGIYMSPWAGPDRLFFIFAFRTPEKKWMGFATDAHLALLSAATWNTGETPVPVPLSDAQPVFNNELGYWAVLAELF
jgi:hypothetical protein